MTLKNKNLEVGLVIKIQLDNNNFAQQGVYFTLGSFPISQLIGFGDTAYRGIGTPFQSPAQNTPPAVVANAKKTARHTLSVI
jgi:hypothetical protein